MTARMRQDIRRSPWWLQIFAWPGYAMLWTIAQVFIFVGWLIRESWSQGISAVSHILRPYILPLVLITLSWGLYTLNPRLFSGLLELGLVVGILWLGATYLFGGLRKPKNKKGGNGH